MSTNTTTTKPHPEPFVDGPGGRLPGSRSYSADERNDAAARLAGMIEAGQTIYTKVKHVSRSGMTRSVEFYVAQLPDARYGEKHPAITKVTHLVARILDRRIDRKNGGAIVGGTGMDMAWHEVYTLSRVMFPEGASWVDGYGKLCTEPKSGSGYVLQSEAL